MNQIIFSFLLVLLYANIGISQAQQPSPATTDNTLQGLLAIVNSEQITAPQYEQAVSKGMRQRFYHGKVPEQELLSYRDEIAQELIKQTLLLKEARKRHLKANEEAVQEQIKQYDQQYGNSSGWQQRRASVMPKIQVELEQQNILQQLERSIKKVGPVSQAEVETYYQNNPDKFTTPKQLHLSLILLKVDPSAPAEVWKMAIEEADALRARVIAGESFSELAKIHSSDLSAEKGGDMGFLHIGMIGENVQQLLEGVKPGEVSTSLQVLEGIALFKLHAIKEQKLNPIKLVGKRAEGLLKRENGENAWQSFIDKLTNDAEIRINKDLINTIPGQHKTAAPK